MPKAAYHSDFRENANFCLQRDWNLGPLAQQISSRTLAPFHTLSLLIVIRVFLVSVWSAPQGLPPFWNCWKHQGFWLRLGKRP